MAYRKLTVDGKEYEYVVGKTHVKIKGVGVFLKEEIGSLQDHTRCECCGESMTVIYGDDDHYKTLVVQPKDVANKIKKVVN